MLKYIVSVDQKKIGITYTPKKLILKVGGYIKDLDEIKEIKDLFTSDNIVFSYNDNKGYYHFQTTLCEFIAIIEGIKKNKKYFIRKTKSIGRIFG